MKIIKEKSQLQPLMEQFRLDGKRIGFVPTMGYLHEGHLSLMRIAREVCDVLVVSIFVNPAQFGPTEDLDAYPSDLQRDFDLIEALGGDVVFTPSNAAMYPDGYKTWVTVDDLPHIMCGLSRPIHFRGVTTIVLKLFNIVKPHVAVFGQKDAQQAIIIRKMVTDLDIDVEIKVGPTGREPDGLALSSRNKYLTKIERADASILQQSLQQARKMIEAGETSSSVILSEMRRMIQAKNTAEIDYIDIRHAETLEELTIVSPDQLILIALAVKFGKARLLDNILI